MSYCKKEGKDKIIFATEEYLSQPSKAVLLPDNPNEIDTSNAGAILPNGEINWDCPCLGNLPNGPCGPNFREAFSCWVENKDNEQGFAEQCFENFSKWEKCLSEYREIYKQSNDEPSEGNQIKSETNNDNTKALTAIEDQNDVVNTAPVNEHRAIAAASTGPKT